MLQLVQRYSVELTADGIEYEPAAFGERQRDDMWFGYLAFVPRLGGRIAVTERETTQGNWDALVYWAAGITPVYLEGALARAIALFPDVQLERRLEEIERLEATASVEASELERVADRARAVAEATAHEREAAERELAMTKADALAEETLQVAAILRRRAR